MSSDLKQALEVLPGEGAAPPQSETVAYAKWLRGRRDRALMLLGFATALRPRELVSIEKKHVARGAKGKSEGIIVHIPRLKADQAAEGQTGFKPLITWPILPHFASLRISTRSIGSRPPPIGSPDGPG